MDGVETEPSVQITNFFSFGVFMTIRVRATIFDEGQLDSRSFTRLITRIENSARNAAAIVTIQFGNDLDLPLGVIQLAMIRISAHPEGLFWIEEIRSRSKILLGRILATALVTTVLNNTLGESLQDGWKRTETHAAISASVPKIEKMLISQFRNLFDRPRGRPIEDDLQIDPVAIRREGEDSIIEITARPSRLKPRF